MKIFNFFLFIFFINLLFCIKSALALDMIDGLWEITTKLETKGFPHIQEQKQTVCLTKENAIPNFNEIKNQNACKILRQNTSGNTISYAFECKEDKTIIFNEGKVNYQNTVFNGENNIIINDPPNEKIQMNYRVIGRRIGDCKK